MLPVNGSIRLLVQFLLDKTKEPLSGFDYLIWHQHCYLIDRTSHETHPFEVWEPQSVRKHALWLGGRRSHVARAAAAAAHMLVQREGRREGRRAMHSRPWRRRQNCDNTEQRGPFADCKSRRRSVKQTRLLYIFAVLPPRMSVGVLSP